MELLKEILVDMTFQNCVVSSYQDNAHSKIIYKLFIYLSFISGYCYMVLDLLPVPGWPQSCGDSLALSP